MKGESVKFLSFLCVYINDAYRPAYRKLTGNTYSGCNQSALIGTDKGTNHAGKTPSTDLHKSIKNKAIGNDCHPMASNNRRGGDSNPR